MICEEALALMSPMLDGQLTPEQSAALEAHLEACPACRDLAQSLRGLDARVAALAEPAPEGLKKGVLYRIDQATGKAKKPRSRWFGPGTALGAVAAVLVLLVGLKVIPLTQYREDGAAPEKHAGEAAAETRAPDTQAPAMEAPLDHSDGMTVLEPNKNAGPVQDHGYAYLPESEDQTGIASPVQMEPGPVGSDDKRGPRADGKAVALTPELTDACAAISAETGCPVLLYTEFSPDRLFALLKDQAPALCALLAEAKPLEREGLLLYPTDCGTMLALQEWLLASLPETGAEDPEAAAAEERLRARMEALDPGSEALYRVLTWDPAEAAFAWPSDWPEGWADRFRAEENWGLFFPDEAYTPNESKTAYLAFIP